MKKIEDAITEIKKNRSLTGKEKERLFNEAKEIKERFENKVKNLSFLKKLFSHSAKKSKEIGDAFFRIEHLIYFEKVAPSAVLPPVTPSTVFPLEALPPDLIREVFEYLNTEDLLHLSSVDKRLNTTVNERLCIRRAREYGYSGNKPVEAKQYLSSLFRGVQVLSREGRLQPAYKEFSLDIEETLKIEKKRVKEKRSHFLGSLLFDYRKQPDVIKALLVLGANPNLKNITGMTPLACAVDEGHTDNVSFLLNLGVDANTVNSIGNTPLIHVSLKESELTRLLLEKGNAKESIDHQNKWGYTALHFAAQKGELETVKLLLKHGANPNLKNHKGVTPLAFAVMARRLDVVSCLLDVGADANIASSAGNTPLIHAQFAGHLEFTRLLLEKGNAHKSIDQQNNQLGRYTALHYAAEKGELETVKLLLKYGANPNLKNYMGMTPSACAAEFGYIDIVSCLHNAKADS